MLEVIRPGLQSTVQDLGRPGVRHLGIAKPVSHPELGDIRLIGQPVTLTSDVYGSSVEYSGRVAGLSAGTGSAFSLLPPQNATGNWIKVVQRVPVRIELDPEPLKKHPLRVGLSMVSTVDTTDTSGPVLTTVARAKPVMATRVYAAELDDVSARVADLIAANAGGQG